jgi:hypothetical protein
VRSCPLHGTIHHEVNGGAATMKVQVSGLPHNSLVAINWSNNTVRGYEVGSVRTNDDGEAIPSSVNLDRPGETSGYKIVLTTTAIDAMTLGTLWPCTSPSVYPLGEVVDPKVTVTPSTGLKGRESIKVSVTGFGEYEKIFLSECDNAEDVSLSGCGPQPALQPFIVTGRDRSGSMSFVVHTSAASKPYDTTALVPCTNLCVVVAHEGTGAWAVAPIAFGSYHLIHAKRSG